MDLDRSNEMIYEFADFRLIPGESLLLRNGSPISLNPKAFAVLVLLVERHGHLVHKSEITGRVWNDAFVEEGAIAKSIWFIRHALAGESKESFIQTVPKRGYRFIAPVNILKEVAANVPKPKFISSGYRLPTTSPLHEHGPEPPSHLSPPAHIQRSGAPAAKSTQHDAYRVEGGIKPSATSEEHESFEQKSSVSYRTLIPYIGMGVAMLAALGFFVLYGRSTSGWSDVTRIAVVPIKPLNADTRDPAYELGIADSLILKLGSSPKLLVKQLSAVRGYTGLEIDPVTIGREQNVDFVLSSHYQLANGRIKFTAQLFRVATGDVEATFTAENDASNLFAAQGAIAESIGNPLLARFDSVRIDPPRKRGTENEEAYRHYQMAMNMGEDRGLKNVQKALEYLERAVAADPNYAAAWAAKAHIHRDIVGQTDADQHEHYRMSMESIEKALAIDPSLSEAYSARCHNKNRYEYDFNGAEADCQRAVQLDPNSPVAHKIYANFLYTRGRFDEAIAEIKTAIDLQPVSYRNQQIYGLALYYARRYDQAEPHFKRLLELNPTHSSIHERLVRILEQQGRESEAFEHLIAMLTLQKADSLRLESLKTVFARSGWRGVVSERIKEEEADPNPSAFQLACLYSRIGDKDKALVHLEKAYQNRSFWVAVIQVEPQLDPLRGDPRFSDLVKRIGLAE